ncbi:MAG: hypothetical protein AB7F75_01150 [Planctomycetota bacterium]
MKKRALVVGSRMVFEEARDRVESLGHTAVHVATQKDALKALEGAQAFDYVVMYLEIPVAKGGPARIPNGQSLIRKIRAIPQVKRLPIFALVAKELASYELINEATRDWGADDLVCRPLQDKGFTLELRITDILKNREMRTLKKKNGLGRSGGMAISMVREACQQYVAAHGDGGAMEVQALMVQGTGDQRYDPCAQASQPIILVTGHDTGVSDHIVSVMRSGGIEFTQLTRKTQGNGRAEKEAPEAKAPVAKAATVDRSASFSAAARQLVIEDDRVTLCGLEVWRDCAHPDLREVLVRLSKKTRNGFVRIRGAQLNRELGRSASNPIARRIKDFRDRVSVVLGRSGIECGKEDVIASQGGYHFAPWVEVKVAVREKGTPAKILL